MHRSLIALMPLLVVASTVFAAVATSIPAAPTGLEARVYSRTAAELFWDRPSTVGLVYEVRRDGRALVTTDGVSHFDDTLAAGRRYAYEVIAIDREGRRSAASAIALSTSGGNDAVPGDGDDLPVPSGFRTLEAVADATPHDVERIDVDASRPDAEGGGYGLLSLSPGAGTPRLGLRRRLPNDERDEFLVYDPETGGAELLLTSSPLTAPTLSRDLSTAAWIDDCLGYVRRLDDGSDPVLLNPLLREDTCLRPPTLSARGETVVFGAARGRLGAAGELVFDGFDNRLFGPIVHRPADGSTTSLAREDITLEDAEDLADVQRVDYGPRIADDGNRVVMRTAFQTGMAQEPTTLGIVAGVLVVDPRAGTVDLVARHTDRRAFCLKCFSRHAEDVIVSGDGRYVFLMRAPDGGVGDEPVPTQLHRHDVRRGETVRVPVDDVIGKRTLVTDHDGDRVAYVTEDGVPVVLRLDTGERLTLDRALRGCGDSGCEFAGYRFVQSTPLSFSADGSVLLIRVIPERSGIDTPQNTSEILVLDVEARTVRRAAPGIDTLVAEASDDGHTLVLEPEAYSGVTDDGTDLLLIRR